MICKRKSEITVCGLGVTSDSNRNHLDCMYYNRYQNLSGSELSKCKRCKMYKSLKRKESAALSVFLCFYFVIICILGTPQGVIRSQILFQRGVSAAMTAVVQNMGYEPNRTSMFKEYVYRVNIEGIEELANSAGTIYMLCGTPK